MRVISLLHVGYAVVEIEERDLKQRHESVRTVVMKANDIPDDVWNQYVGTFN